MDVDSASEHFTITMKEEPNQLDGNEEEQEIPINPNEIVETKQECKNEMVDLDPLEMVNIKCEPELCLSDLLVPSVSNDDENVPTVSIPSQIIKVKNESELISEDTTVALMPSLFSLDENNKKDPEEDLTCDVCDKKFTLNIKLNLHKRKNTCKKIYKCETCTSTFEDQPALIAHIFTHINNTTVNDPIIDGKRYKCGECFKEFSELTSFRAHVGLHTGHKPFKCDDCGASFVRNSHLTTHKLIHTEKKDHKCDECGKRFFQMSNLKQHLRTHSGEKPFKCNFCDKEFGHNKNLKLHTRRFHMDNLALIPFEQS